MQQQGQRTGKTRTDSPDGGDGMKDDSFEEYLTIPIKGRKIRLLVEGEVTAEILTSFGRYLRLVRDDLPGDPAENRDETDTEEGSDIPKEPAESLLDEGIDDQNGHSGE